MKQRSIAAALAAVLSVTGCAEFTPPVAPVGLQPPPAWALVPPKGPAPVPENDGDLAVRRAHLLSERLDHAQCTDRHAVLRLWVEKVASQ